MLKYKLNAKLLWDLIIWLTCWLPIINLVFIPLESSIPKEGLLLYPPIEKSILESKYLYLEDDENHINGF